MKLAIVYWSGTGNTEAMANAIADGAKAAGAEVELLTCADMDAAKAADYDALAFGCPAMGAEDLEDMEFAPMWENVAGALAGKRVVLFGSYGWGDGEWLRTWKDNAPCEILDTYACQETPDDSAVAELNALGEKLVK